MLNNSSFFAPIPVPSTILWLWKWWALKTHIWIKNKSDPDALVKRLLWKAVGQTWVYSYCTNLFRLEWSAEEEEKTLCGVCFICMLTSAYMSDSGKSKLFLSLFFLTWDVIFNSHWATFSIYPVQILNSSKISAKTLNFNGKLEYFSFNGIHENFEPNLTVWHKADATGFYLCEKMFSE